MNDAALEALFRTAEAEGRKAGNACIPTPMLIREEIGPNPGRIYGPIMDGVCGFAWIVIKPGTCRAARMAKELYRARTAYGGGMQIWVNDYGQSMTRKAAYAEAFARVLQGAGIKAYADSRMD